MYRSVRRVLAWASRRAGRRGAFLAFLTLVDWGYGYSLLTAPAAQQRAADLLLPWAAWGIIWAAAGAVTVSGVFARRDRLQYGTASLVKAAWGLLQAYLWLSGGMPRGWVGAVIWLGFAAIVLVVAGWPEPGRVITVTVPSPDAEPER